MVCSPLLKEEEKSNRLSLLQSGAKCKKLIFKIQKTHQGAKDREAEMSVYQIT